MEQLSLAHEHDGDLQKTAADSQSSAWISTRDRPNPRQAEQCPIVSLWAMFNSGIGKCVL